ncbi:hypothetical protein HEP87_23155 [Streptomyces sp. S1D4-11]|nr:hypothetical protein [Streptomyces sp. S1D4-11]QIY96384.1 hypothetical protein HEP87_23155 [Streptomyces sp. S1D4-11]
MGTPSVQQLREDAVGIGFEPVERRRVEGEDLRERYLAGIGERLHAYGVGYFASRNLEVEGLCHKAILAGSDGGELFTSAAGRELLINCDDCSNEMLSALRPFVKDD